MHSQTKNDIKSFIKSAVGESSLATNTGRHRGIENVLHAKVAVKLDSIKRDVASAIFDKNGK